MKKVFSGVLFLAVIAGCATKVAGLKQSATFTHPALLNGKIAVGGVAAATETLDEGKRSTYSNLLRTALLEERKELTVLPVGTVINKVGPSQYQQMLAELQTSGLLSDKSLNTLKSKVADTRYITFARVENDEVNHDRNETANQDRNGKTIEGSEKVVTTARRDLTASLLVYDLKEGDVAWSGSITKSLSNTRQYDKERELGLVSVIKAIKGSEQVSDAQKYPYPTAPESHKVLALVFEGFGENLPEKD